MIYKKDQDLNRWVEMLSNIYSSTANYSKSTFEIFTHLTEVTLAFGKMFFKKREIKEAEKFLPKIFSWSVALLLKVKGDKVNLEEIIYDKFPKVCPYCLEKTCTCVKNKKTKIDQNKLRDKFDRNVNNQHRSMNDFQKMFKNIYGHTWHVDTSETGSDEYFQNMRLIYLNMTEELSEISESLRFYQLYPTNFDNEMADFLAWWFAIVSCFHKAYTHATEEILAADLLWEKYPAACSSCLLNVCDCRPGPVRELLSKPSIKQLHQIDPLTNEYNKGKFDEDIQDIGNNEVNMPLPIACIRIDLDGFTAINDISHDVGDIALKYFVRTTKQKIRTRDRLYRVGGDEFAILCPDLSANEAMGMLSRVANFLTLNPMPETDENAENKIIVTFSAGIVECTNLKNISQDFARADKLQIQGNQNGGNQIRL